VRGCLLVKANGSSYGIRIDQVLEVRDGFEVHQAPGLRSAVRGVTPLRGRLVPLVHLGALVTNTTPSQDPCPTLVLVQVDSKLLALEVEDADEVASEDLLPVPDAWQLPWACGVCQRGPAMIPVIDVELLAERLAPAEMGGQT
jgi:chemotaxis signal transduction protein